MGNTEMFCNFCGKQNRDDTLFCEFCGKAFPKKSLPLSRIQFVPQENQRLQKSYSPKSRISFTAIKALITLLMIVGLIIILFQIYYPGLLPWNW
jgi:uncharacterized membrane protein YvbJ